MVYKAAYRRRALNFPHYGFPPWKGDNDVVDVQERKKHRRIWEGRDSGGFP